MPEEPHQGEDEEAKRRRLLEQEGATPMSSNMRWQHDQAAAGTAFLDGAEDHYVTAKRAAAQAVRACTASATPATAGSEGADEHVLCRPGDDGKDDRYTGSTCGAAHCARLVNYTYRSSL